MALVIPIADPLDPRLAVYRAVRERDVAGRQEGFIAEGEVVLRRLARSRLHRPQSLLVAAERLPRVGDLLAAFPDGMPIYAATREVMDTVVGFPIHRGLLAYGVRGSAITAADLLAATRPDALVLALISISNHDNMGGIFRNAAAFGAEAVILDPTCCDPLYRKSIRVSVGAALGVPFARLAAGEDMIDILESADFTPLALSPTGETPLYALKRPARTAVLLGAEGDGLPAHVLIRAQSVTIPMASGWDSLNVATTSGIVLHHLASLATDVV